VHLLVTYGTRRQQVAALKLQDIDWEDWIRASGPVRAHHPAARTALSMVFPVSLRTR